MNGARTFRIFVSSTFSDLKAERDALQERVFPRLRALCEAHGCRFQAIDLRWGVSEEAGLDQQTMKICLGEIERCQAVSPRPNFIVLLGDRYGWRPLPYEIPGVEFQVLLNHIQGDDRRLVLEWYRRDDNALPALYLLQPRPGRFAEQSAWEPVEHRLHALLEAAAREARLPEASQFKYSASATEQEILQGLIQVPGASEHVFCYARQSRFDSGEQTRPDQNLSRLKDRLRSVLGEHFHTYAMDGTEAETSPQVLERLCADVTGDLERIILAEVNRLDVVDPHAAEIAAHAEFGAQRRGSFTGRDVMLKAISDYLDGKDKNVLVLWGESGSGKSAIMAQAAWAAEKSAPGAQVITRFTGATPRSTERVSLLQSLCLEVYQRDARSSWLGTDVPGGYRALVEEFTVRLNLAMASAEKPLFIFVDALDLLDGADLDWVPDQLPAHVRMVVSTTPGIHLESVKARAPAAKVLQVGELSLSEAVQLVDQVLERSQRRLQPAQRQQVIENIQRNRLPLYLKLLSEEVRNWTSYAGPEEMRLAPDVPGAIQNLLDRLASASRHGELLVGRALGYLAAARHGLTEDELLGVLSDDVELYEWFLNVLHHTPPDLLKVVYARLEGEGLPCSAENATTWLDRLRRDPGALAGFLHEVQSQSTRLQLPVVLWSRLFHDLEPYLIHRQGDGTALISFFHRQFSDAVRERYLPAESGALRHQALARFFVRQPVYLQQDAQSLPNLRKLSEQLYHQAHARQWKDVETTLTSADFFRAFIQTGRMQALLADFDLAFTAGGDSNFLRQVQGALRASKHVLERDPDQLPTQLAGRLGHYRNYGLGDVDKLLDGMKKWDKPWLNPTVANLTPAGTALLHNLYGHTGSVTYLALSPDGRRILSGSRDQSVNIWDMTTGERLTTLKGHIDSVDGLWVSPDSRHVVSSSFDMGSQLVVWNLADGLQVSAFGHSGMVLGLGFTPDGRKIVSACSDGYLNVWELESGEELSRARDESGFNGFALASNGKTAITSSEEDRLLVWDLETGAQAANLDGHTGENVPIVVSTDGPLTLAGGMEDYLSLVDLPGKQILTRLNGSGPTACLAITPDGRRAVSGSADHALRVWDLQARRLLFKLTGHTGKILEVVLSSDGRRAASAASGDLLLKIWDLEKGAEIASLQGHTDAVNALALSSDGQRLVSAASDQSIKVWDMDAGTQRRLERQHSGAVRDIAIAASVGRVVSVSSDGKLKLWWIGGASAWVELDTNSDPWSVAVSAIGDRAASGGLDGTIKVWDLSTHKLLCTLSGKHGIVRGLALTSDGKRALAGYDDGTLILWDVDTGRDLRNIVAYEPVPHRSIGAWKVALSMGGRWAVACSRAMKGIRLWDMQTGSLVATYSKHTDSVTAVDLTLGGRYAASGSRDQSVRVYDLTQGTQLMEFTGHTGEVKDVAIDEKEKLVASAGADSTLRIWDWGKGEQLACLTGESEFTCCAITGKRVVAGDAAGGLHFLTLEG